MPYEFDQAAVAYSEARSQCQVATDDALDTAQDLEAVAVEGLINTPSEWPWASAVFARGLYRRRIGAGSRHSRGGAPMKLIKKRRVNLQRKRHPDKLRHRELARRVRRSRRGRP
jgi:hypothetical protein